MSNDILGTMQLCIRTELPADRTDFFVCYPDIEPDKKVPARFSEFAVGPYQEIVAQIVAVMAMRESPKVKIFNVAKFLADKLCEEKRLQVRDQTVAQTKQDWVIVVEAEYKPQ